MTSLPLDEPLLVVDAEDKPKPTPVHLRKDFWLICTFGFLLAIVSGYLNVVALLVTTNVVTHHTGTVTWMGRWFGEAVVYPTAEGSGKRFWWAVDYILILGFFMMGAAFCGFFIENQAFHDSRLYGFFMIVVAAGIFVVEILFDVTESSRLDPEEPLLIDLGFYTDVPMLIGVMIGSFISGIQNGICTNLTGMVVRTTHVTGLSTDFGLVIGRWFRDKCGMPGPDPETWRLKVLFPILIGYIFGCFLGTVMFNVGGFDNDNRLGSDALLFPGFAAGTMGVTWLAGSVYNKFRDFNVEVFPVVNV